MDFAKNRSRKAEWIWTRPPRRERAGMIPRGEPDFSRDMNRYVYFRKEFEVAGDIQSALIHASADGRYILYLNGIQIGRGPARCHPGWQYIDPLDLSSLLSRGTNVLTALVHSYGRDTSWYELPRGAQAILFGCGGFYLQSAIATTDGLVAADTDDSWKFLSSKAWERDTPFGGTGFVERYDADKEPVGWHRAGFDDTVWESACVQRIDLPQAGTDIVPFPRLVERDIASLRETMVRPKRILSDGTPSARSGSVTVFDFGGILMGRVSFEVDALAGSILEIECSESLGSAGRIFRPEAIPGISTPLVHSFRLREGRQSHTLFEAAGFRFVQVGVSGCTRPLELISLCALETRYPGGDPDCHDDPRAPDDTGDSDDAAGQGSFVCSDPELTALWKAGARTAAICRQDGLIDCPSREQRQWTGDPYIQALLNYVTVRDTRLVRKYLLQSAQTQRPDGMIMMASTSDLGAEAKTFIPDFCLFWILAIDKYILYTGDTSILMELFPSVAKAIAWFIPWIDEYGLLSDTPGWIFIDWSAKLERRGEVLALNALFAAALRAGARVAGLVDAHLYRRQWEALAASVAAAADARLWDETRGLYADARTDAGLSKVASQQGNAAAIAFGVAPTDRAARAFRAILDESRLKLTQSWRWDIERPFDPEHDIVLAQPFFSHFLHGALAACGRVDDIIANLKTRWSSMLLDCDTFRESWQLTEMTSRCHAFSATPAYDLSTWVLGIRPVADGFSRFKVAPHFGELEWARGRVPTPTGMISVTWERHGESIAIDVIVPSGLSGELEVRGRSNEPDGDRSILELSSGRNNFSLPGFRQTI